MLSHKPQGDQGDGKPSLSVFLSHILSLSRSPTTLLASQATERWNPGHTPVLRWQHLVGMVAHFESVTPP